MVELIIFLPLLGAVLAGLLGRVISAQTCAIITCVCMTVAAGLSAIIFADVAIYNESQSVTILEWIHVGTFEADWKLRIDTLTAVMLVVVNSISMLVHIYSIGYMHHDPHRPRFFAYLSFFTFAMLMLVTADNFLQLFFGWEGVGLASYLLIGFWFKKPSANAAAIKAFIVNRVGDFGFMIGLAALYFAVGSIHFDDVFAAAPVLAKGEFMFLGQTVPLLTTICLLLFMGAMGKSAQFLLHTWLPDAMEGPTPVSALIHAATMVTAGIFLVARCSPLFEYAPDALAVVTVVGSITAFFAATVALVQNDIKRVIAYSTCSQLGYMFVALGIGAYQIAIFHLFTHAFFKALLFLGAGSVIHAVEDEQDMRKMGGLREMIPFTWMLMLIGTLALTGFPLTAGYYSKDAIIEAAFAAHSAPHMFAFTLLLITALLTAFYSWRLMFMTFHGKTHLTNDQLSRVHESPPVMMIPLILLAIGALFAGFTFKDLFIGDGQAGFWRAAIFNAADNHILHDLHLVPAFIPYTASIMMVLGFLCAWLFYIRRPNIPKQIAEQQDVIYNFLLNKWYFDEIYDFIFVRPAKWLARLLWKKGDGFIIDGFGPDGIAAQVQRLTKHIVKLQSGYVYHYAFAMLAGIVGLTSWFMLTGGP
ncbi:MAG: NADH-quinone oxidoreductase subunit L [Alphaproteobacteria bacterium]|nr:NADH-quinone oxidoreductase subunit L [Alphaproteobacteria bacterium]